MPNSTNDENTPDTTPDTAQPADTLRILVTGASGYVGGQLVPRLLDAGHMVRILTRNADSVSEEDWAEQVEISEGDASEAADLDRALENVQVAYYLLHSMDGGGDFHEREVEMAQTFADCAERAGVGRIVYLGGIHPHHEELSEHMASRVDVGQVFLDCSVPAACLQAGVVLGAGSVSFQMLRHLTERLPVMITPEWLRNRIQPVAVDDAMHYLVGAATLPPEVNRTLDIAGPEVLTYEQMMQRYAEVTGLPKRLMVPVPVLTPQLASYWIGLVTPIDSGVARPLVGSLVHDVVADDTDIVALVGAPPGGRTGYDEAVRRAVAEMRAQEAEEGGENAPDGRRVLAFTSAATAVSAIVGAVATDPNSRWYKRLDLPAWQPPAAAFPTVWTALYASIATIAAHVLEDLEKEGREDEAEAFARALGINLVLNSAWSVLFWRSRRLDIATVEAAALAASSVFLARRAWKVDRRHGLGLAPYAVWCTFATALTAEIHRRNPR